MCTDVFFSLFFGWGRGEAVKQRQSRSEKAVIAGVQRKTFISLQAA